MNTEKIIEVRNIHRSLPLKNQDLHILRGLDLSVNPGEWVALSGPSGSGKSTLLGILGGIDRPSSGQVFIDGQEIGQLPEPQLARLRNRKIGIVFQTFNLIPTMTALENVEIPLYIGAERGRARQVAAEFLEMVGMSDRLRHLPHQLSGGQQQRVAIARALATRPVILLADEPTGNLDSVSGRQIMSLIQRLRQKMNLTVVMVTHDPQIAAHADREYHMIDGRFVSGIGIRDNGREKMKKVLA